MDNRIGRKGQAINAKALCARKTAEENPVYKTQKLQADIGNTEQQQPFHKTIALPHAHAPFTLLASIRGPQTKKTARG